MISTDRQHQLVYLISSLKQVRFITTEQDVSSDSFYVKFSLTNKMYASRIGAQIWNSIPYSIKEYLNVRPFVKK